MSDILEELDCMTPGQAALFSQPEAETYTGRAAAEIRRLRAENAYQHLLYRDARHFRITARLRADEAEAAIARVRALCPDTGSTESAYVRQVDILRALDGAE